MDNQIHCSVATPNDIQGILDTIKAERGDTREISSSQFVIAKDRDKVIGCVRTKTLKDGTVEMASLVVLPAYRGKGVGSALVKSILEKDKRRPVYILCKKDNEQFYLKLGFKTIKPDVLPEVLIEEYKRIGLKLKELKWIVIAMITE